MNLTERKYRFTEIVTAITLLPELNEQEEVPVLPNGTLGLADGNLKSALASQCFREGEEFGNKLVNALVGSAMKGIAGKEKDEQPPSKDDMSAYGLAMSIAWSHGEIPYFLVLSGMLATIWERNKDRVEDCGYLIPSDVIAILGDGEVAQAFKKFEPYDLLEGIPNLIGNEALPTDVLEQIKNVINKELDDRGGE